MEKIEKYNYKNLYEMKVIEFETEENHIFKTVEVNKLSSERFVTDIYAHREFEKNDKQTVNIELKLGTTSYGTLTETQWDLYISNLLESKKAYDYFKSILKETNGYKVIER